MAIAEQTRAPVRRRLSDGLDESDHPVLHELAASGITDYIAIPIRFLNRRGAMVTIATDRAEGFADGDIAGFFRLTAVLGPIVDAAAAHNLAESVASAYIGPRSGARVLDGQIERGDVEELRAAIWFSDLRDWSRIANTLPAADAIALVNDYFELVDGAITDHGGEVLKLIGDAVLAIFPVGDNDDEAAATGSALNAAVAAQNKAAAAGSRFAFGTGLHLGELVYGNVGSPTRLDFTVMGQAVNLAARIEKLSRPLGRPIILSKDFARSCGRPCDDLGDHDVAGWDVPVHVFAPAG